MTDEQLSEMFAAHLRGERAIAAARRWISRNTKPVLRKSDVVEFLRHPRYDLAAAEIEYCATEALKHWLSSRANRYRGPRRRAPAGRDVGKP